MNINRTLFDLDTIIPQLIHISGICSLGAVCPTPLVLANVNKNDFSYVLTTYQLVHASQVAERYQI